MNAQPSPTIRNRPTIRTPNSQHRSAVAIDRKTLKDTSISYAAAGLRDYLLAMPDDWTIQPDTLKRKGAGRDKVYSLLHELIEARYISREIEREPDGKVKGIIYQLYETPYEPLPEKPDTAKPDITESKTLVSLTTFEIPQPPVATPATVLNTDQKTALTGMANKSKQAQLPGFSEESSTNNDWSAFHFKPQYTPKNTPAVIPPAAGDCWRCQGTGLVLADGADVVCGICHGTGNRPATPVAAVKPAPAVGRHRVVYLTDLNVITAHYVHGNAKKSARCGKLLPPGPEVTAPPGPFTLCPVCQKLATPPIRDALFDAVGEHAFGKTTPQARAAVASMINAGVTRLLLLKGCTSSKDNDPVINDLLQHLPQFGKDWQSTGLSWFSNAEHFTNQYDLWEKAGYKLPPRTNGTPDKPREKQPRLVQNPDGPGLITVWE